MKNDLPIISQNIQIAQVRMSKITGSKTFGSSKRMNMQAQNADGVSDFDH